MAPRDAAALHALGVALLTQEGLQEAGADSFFMGVQDLREAAAERYFEDALGLIKESEEGEWLAADPEGRRQWLRSFWELRAAVAGVTVPERLGEHYRRLALAHRYPSGAPYRTELTIEPSGTRGVWSRLRGLLGLEPLPPGLTLRFEGEAGPLEGPGQRELRRITAPLLPGSYTLRVRVTNPEWDESATRETEFNVVE